MQDEEADEGVELITPMRKTLYQRQQETVKSDYRERKSEIKKFVSPQQSESKSK